MLGHLYEPTHLTAFTLKFTFGLEVETVVGLVQEGRKDGLLKVGQIPEAASNFGEGNVQGSLSTGQGTEGETAFPKVIRHKSDLQWNGGTVVGRQCVLVHQENVISVNPKLLQVGQGGKGIRSDGADIVAVEDNLLEKGL